ncbi:hypothetical protein [Paraflavitalea sp. CAU 1676]|uniref:hypothetical protein n=1 Tax=Paraflavitalea sp. CAU 1676 TaxID=3032598 RepID=UPI0023D9E616|nr:hypothetical protein [Paraflavitalea sp. CAU 1676]MDF2189999.1 hypothetical protein [Paraflavitalea sp. CAU 1676]
MKSYFLLLPVFLLIVACKGKKTSLQDDETVTVKEFIEFFPESPLPIRIADTTLLKKSTDSLQIGYKIFKQFIPDSLIQADFGKGVTPKLFPLGRTQEDGKETYLFIKATTGAKRVGYLACFNKDNEFLKMMPLVKQGFDQYSSTYGMLDRKFQITTYYEKKRANNETTFKRNVYIYNSGANEFTLILTEPNEEIIENVINPIDTLPIKNKFSGDYVKDKKNFIAVRDGKRASEPLVFIHFEKSDCRGEVKGVARFVSASVAVFQESGNPCTIEFTFSANRVVIKETGGCGSYRDIKCFFEGSYPKKKAPAKPKAGKK